MSFVVPDGRCGVIIARPSTRRSGDRDGDACGLPMEITPRHVDLAREILNLGIIAKRLKLFLGLRKISWEKFKLFKLLFQGHWLRETPVK